MSKSCLHCAIHAVLRDHFADGEAPRTDGLTPIVPNEALNALSAVTADVIGSAASEKEKVSAFLFLFAALSKHLGDYGVHLNGAVTVPQGAQTTERVR